MKDDKLVTLDDIRRIEDECNNEFMQWKQILNLGKYWRQDDRVTKAILSHDSQAPPSQLY